LPSYPLTLKHVLAPERGFQHQFTSKKSALFMLGESSNLPRATETLVDSLGDDDFAW